MYNLADLLETGADGVPIDVSTANNFYERAVTGGHVGAMNKLAFILEQGTVSVAKNVLTALDLYQKAVAKYHVGAMRRLDGSVIYMGAG